LMIYQQFYDPGGLAMTLCGLTDSAQATGDYQSACNYLCEALEIANRIHWTQLTLWLLISASDLLYQIGEPERSIELQTLVLAQPATDQEMKEHVHHSLTRLRSRFPHLVLDASPRSSTESDLHAAAASFYAYLRAQGKTLIEHAPPMASQQSTPSHSEPLTERELEVLRLMVDGLSNPQIAEHLVVSTGAVKAHTNRIFGKLGVTNRVQAVNRAKELHLF